MSLGMRVAGGVAVAAAVAATAVIPRQGRLRPSRPVPVDIEPAIRVESA